MVNLETNGRKDKIKNSIWLLRISMKFLKKIQKELTRTMKIKYSKVGLSVNQTRVVRFMAIALTAIPRFPFTNFSGKEWINNIYFVIKYY